MWPACLLLLCLAAGSRQLSITEFSVPAAVEAGQDAHLKCQYGLSENESDKALFVKWWWTPLNSSGDERSQLYQRIAGYSPEAIPRNVEVENNDGIKLLNVSPSDSGVYECEVSNIDEVRKRQKLVVFSVGRGPLLNVSLAADAALVSCEAYDVAPLPDLAISLNGHIVESSGNVSESADGLYDIYENATIDVAQADGGEFRCEIFFEDDDVIHAPFVASETFDVPAAAPPAPAPAERAPDRAPHSSQASQPGDSASANVGAAWTALAAALCLLSLGTI